MNLRQFPIAVIGLGLLCFALVAGQSHQAGQSHPAEHAWDYSGGSLGPSHWGDLKPEYEVCKIGHTQSPIDIETARKADLPAIEFNYKASPLRIIDNGHTIMINYAPGSFIRVRGRQYELKQFHFHKPSEEKIKGKSFDMVAHLVHADSDGKLAVVAVLLDQGSANPLIHELWNNLPKEKEKEEAPDKVQIDATQLLPVDRGYYTFSGSLTTPPCSENVTWFVLKQAGAISSEEIATFSSVYPNNARPIQPLNGRPVLESK